jgi:predicted amino acid racemase
MNKRSKRAKVSTYEKETHMNRDRIEGNWKQLKATCSSGGVSLMTVIWM